MKKTIIIILVVILLITGIYFGLKYWKKYKDSSYLYPELQSFSFDWKIEKLTDLTKIAADIADGYTTATVKVNFKNYSSSEFTLNSFFFELYTKDNEYFAGQIEPYNENLVIPAAGNVIFNIQVSIKFAGILALANTLNLQGTPTDKVAEILRRYYINGKIGAEIKLKGNFSAEGFKLISLPLELDINI